MNQLSEGFECLYLIEARMRGSSDRSDEWEPVSLSLGRQRKFHYANYESAQESLRGLLRTDQDLPHLVVRLATGADSLENLLEFRIVEVRAVQEVQRGS